MNIRLSEPAMLDLSAKLASPKWSSAPWARLPDEYGSDDLLYVLVVARTFERNIYDTNELAETGFEYSAIGC